MTNVVLEEIPEQSAGQGSGIQSAFRQLGSALGIAVLTTVFFSTLNSTLNNDLTGSGVDQAQADQLTRQSPTAQAPPSTRWPVHRTLPSSPTLPNLR